MMHFMHHFARCIKSASLFYRCTRLIGSSLLIFADPGKSDAQELCIMMHFLLHFASKSDALHFEMSNIAITVRIPDDLAVLFKTFKDSNDHKSDNSAAIALFREVLVHQNSASLVHHESASLIEEFAEFKAQVTKFMNVSLVNQVTQMDIASLEEKLVLHTHGSDGKTSIPTDAEIDRLDKIKMSAFVASRKGKVEDAK